MISVQALKHLYAGRAKDLMLVISFLSNFLRHFPLLKKEGLYKDVNKPDFRKGF